MKNLTHTTLLTTKLKELFLSKVLEIGTDEKAIIEAGKNEIFTRISDSATKEERFEFWSGLREYARKHLTLIEKERKKREREARKNKRTIKIVVDELLATRRTSSFEDKFLNNIKNKRKLTSKQGKWLNDICFKLGVTIADFEEKSSSNAVHNCQHEDLGSLGYKHGTTVKCPFCGKLAEVW
jgi:hypothetical protein